MVDHDILVFLLFFFVWIRRLFVSRLICPVVAYHYSDVDRISFHYQKNPLVTNPCLLAALQ